MAHTAVRALVLVVFRAGVLGGVLGDFLVGMAGSGGLLGQSPQAASSAQVRAEFPVTMRQSVKAGKTPVGAKVEAKLTVATLVSGAVIPKGAIFMGEVLESKAKSADGPSRLAIGFDSARWKGETAPVEHTFAGRLYLTEWYYPPPELNAHGVGDASQGVPEDTTPRSRPRPIRPASPPNPPLVRSGSGAGSAPTAVPESDAQQRRLVLKDVGVAHLPGGAITLNSTRADIKLDKQTRYVLMEGAR